MRPLKSWIAALLLAATPLVHAEIGVTAERILIGQTGAASGPLATLNSEYLGGAGLYFDTVNRGGGVHGRKIELITLDDAYDAERAEQNTRTLIQDRQVFALFGCFGTGPSLRTIPVATEARVPFFAPYTGADILRSMKPEVFHMRASYGQEIEKIVSHLVSAGITSIGVVHHADSFGTAGLDVARKALAGRGLTAVVEVPVKASAEDAEQAADKIAQTNPAALIMVTAGKSSIGIMQGLRTRDARPMLYGLSVISANQLIKTLGENAHGLVIAQVVPSPFRFDHEVVQAYRNAAEAAKVEISYTSLEGYMAAKVLTEGLTRASAELTRDKLIKALESLKGWDAGGVKIGFSPRDHVASKFVDLAIISRGKYLR
ncbi:ABC transporter substrate-binding protein [Denitromonas halophila]|uniref:ABC transporter substrate-binding protein n=1 Tax=Denitromonas halophila TaxID=1629404 RepID=A0A557QYP6_9RHOO|nr:ABC transporter substrate-binding protein [Denitromonas halophila]TVO58027.1 ABC transporter substrate-binding protein [Denitromonas halophila]